MKGVINLLSSYQGILAGLGSIIPGFLFFTNYAPPLFREVTILSSALCIAALVFITESPTPRTTASTLKRHRKKSVRYLVLGFIMALLYLFLVSFTTVVTPDAEKERWQIGFDVQPWNLTHEANVMIENKECPHATSHSLLLCSGFTKESIELVWKKGYVYLAGILLILSFTLGSVFWTMGWAYLSKWKLNNKKKQTKITAR
ncbi:MAG: hypothetical protein SH856_12035 [Flavobacteriales bacterium]|nr:hypothetical protein [Flavobacteriales bacterium]